MSTSPPEQPQYGGAFPGEGGGASAPPPGSGETPGKATASLIIGILSLVICAPAGILAIIYGNQAKQEIDANPSLGGRGLAQAGVVLGWIAVAFLIIGIVILAIALAAG